MLKFVLKVFFTLYNSSSSSAPVAVMGQNIVVDYVKQKTVWKHEELL